MLLSPAASVCLAFVSTAEENQLLTSPWVSHPSWTGWECMETHHICVCDDPKTDTVVKTTIRSYQWIMSNHLWCALRNADPDMLSLRSKIAARDIFQGDVHTVRMLSQTVRLQYPKDDYVLLDVDDDKRHRVSYTESWLFGNTAIQCTCTLFANYSLLD